MSTLPPNYHGDTYVDFLGDLAQAAQTATGSGAFADALTENIRLYRDKKRRAYPAVSEILNSAHANGVDIFTGIGGRALTVLLEIVFTEKGFDINTVWADREQARATADRKADFLADVSPKLNNKALADYMFEAVWLA